MFPLGISPPAEISTQLLKVLVPPSNTEFSCSAAAAAETPIKNAKLEMRKARVTGREERDAPRPLFDFSLFIFNYQKRREEFTRDPWTAS